MPPALRDYLDLTPADALVQWKMVLARTPKARQDRFLPIEAILCCGLFFVLTPNRYGGANIASAPGELHKLASLFSRPPGSLTNKMLNLDGTRPNAGRTEPDVHLHLFQHIDLLFRLYQIILSTARQAGISESRLPDFLGVSQGDIALLGQDEIGSSEIDLSIREQDAQIRHLMEATGLLERETMRLVEQRVRLGQHRFARAVLANYGYRCGFCGLPALPRSPSGSLRASHVKAWAVSNNRERLDPLNGIAACPTHDHAFDQGLLTVNGGLRIHRAGDLDAFIVAEPEARWFFDPPALRERLLVAPEVAPRSHYLSWHHERHQFRRLG